MSSTTFSVPQLCYRQFAVAATFAAKYVVQTGPTGEAALYNLATDVGERTDLSVQETQRARLLQSALSEWEKDVGYQEPKPAGPLGSGKP